MKEWSHETKWWLPPTFKFGLRTHLLLPVYTINAIDRIQPIDTINPIDTIDPINAIDTINAIDRIQPTDVINPIDAFNPIDTTFQFLLFSIFVKSLQFI